MLKNAKQIGNFLKSITGQSLSKQEEAQAYWETRKTARNILEKDLSPEQKRKLLEIRTRKAIGK